MAVGATFAAHAARLRRVPLFGVLLAGVIGRHGHLWWRPRRRAHRQASHHHARRALAPIGHRRRCRDFWFFTIYVAFYPAVGVTVIVVASLRVLGVRLGWTSRVFPGDDLNSDDP
jgi:hypothetical protein